MSGHLKTCSPEERKKICSEGGKAVSKDRKHMREIGHRGGIAVSMDRDHMSRLGKLGAEKRWPKNSSK